MQDSSTDLNFCETLVREELMGLSNNVRKSYLVVKRIIDIIGSSIGIILLLPVFIIVSILIKLEDPKGKIFFGQERCGQYSKTFKMLKFRSMVYNAEELLKD